MTEHGKIYKTIFDDGFGKVCGNVCRLTDAIKLVVSVKDLPVDYISFPNEAIDDVIQFLENSKVENEVEE